VAGNLVYRTWLSY